jgi:protein TonB
MRLSVAAGALAGIAFVSLLAAPPAPAQAANEIDQHLRDQYQGKTLLLRNFLVGGWLTYEADGTFTGAANSGDWTVDGLVRVDNLRVSRNRLIIDATRLFFIPTAQARSQTVPGSGLQIEVHLGRGGFRRDAADAVMSKVFLTPEDDFAASVPDYWKLCVYAGLAADGPQKQTGCWFSPEFLKIPGVALHPGKPPNPQELFPEAARAATRFDNGVKPPRRVSGPEPEFPEEARRMRYQGATTLGVVINENGDVQKIWIISPLGYGLDLRAMKAVSRWKFQPATKDGQPVAAQVVVETDFHLRNGKATN